MTAPPFLGATMIYIPEKKDTFIKKTPEKDGYCNEPLCDEPPYKYTDHDARLDRARNRDDDKTR